MPGGAAAKQNIVSIVFSFRNEEANIEEMVRHLAAVFAPLDCDFEAIFVNDDSTDRSVEILERLRRSDPRLKLVNMARRFGVYECQFAGIAHAAGDAVICMDADLQDPPEEIPGMIAKWRDGADVVYTVRSRRLGERPFKMWLTRQAYRVIRWLSEIDLPVNAGDFRLMSRRVVEVLLTLQEHNPYTRGLVTWVGFKQVPHYYERKARHAGETHMPLLRFSGPTSPLGTLVYAITSFSMKPLYLVAAAGLFGLFAALAGIVALAVLCLLDVQAGPAWWLAALGLFFWASLMFAAGLNGLYLARVYRDVRGRPRYIVKDTSGIEKAPPAQILR